MKRTPTDVVIERFGGVTNAARALNINYIAIIMWRRRGGLIPSKYQTKIKQVLNERISYKELVVGSET